MTPHLSPKENSNTALERLRDLIRCGDVGVGGKLATERTLSEKLGLSRRAVRRALEVLEAEGAIWRKQGSGTFIGQKPQRWGDDLETIVAGSNFMEVMEVRLRIEPQLAQLAALRAKSSDIERMRDLAQKIVGSEDADAKELWDGALHRQIAQAAGNRLFLTIFDVINRVRQDEAWQSIRELARSSADTMTISNTQHAAIIDGIAARNPARAGEAMRQHLLMLQEQLIRQTSLDHLEDGPPSAGS